MFTGSVAAGESDERAARDPEPNTTGSLMDQWPTTAGAAAGPRPSRRQHRRHRRRQEAAADLARALDPPRDELGRPVIDRAGLLATAALVIVVGVLVLWWVSSLLGAGTTP